MTRQSTRIKQSAQPKYADSDSDMGDQPGPSSKPLKRKRKAESPTSSSAGPANVATATVKSEAVDKELVRPAKRVRGKRGILQQLVEMPLDLLFEIFGELDPIDVLNLSRTTKALRNILMSRSAAFIWKAALENVPDLPPCPDDLNEPQWVDLVFGRNCYFCDRATPTTSQTFAWQARVKGCLKCILAEFSMRSSDCYGNNILNLVPSIYIESSGRRSDRGWHYHTATYKEYVAKETRLTNLEERKAWFEERKAEKQCRIEHASACKTWIEQRVSERANDREELRKQRKNCLRQKLEGLGYGSMVELAFDRHDFWKEPVIAGALKKDITDRIWAGMEEKVINIMEGFRDEHTKLERAKHRKSRFQWLLEVHQAYLEETPLGELIIPVVDLFACDDVRKVIMSEPLEEPLKPEAAGAIAECIPEYTAEWLSKSKQKLLDLVKPDAAKLAIDPESLTEETLDLAVVSFECTRCLSWNGSEDSHVLNRALRHKCTVERPGYGYRDTGDVELDAFSAFSRGVKWNQTNTLKLKLQGGELLVAAMRLLELDPATTTVETMDALDPIFELQYTPQGQLTSTWRGVLNTKLKPVLKIVDEQTATFVRAHLDTMMRSDRAQPGYNKLHCPHCKKSSNVNSSLLRRHLKEVHDIDPATDEDVWVDWDRRYERMTWLYAKHPGATII